MHRTIQLAALLGTATGIRSMSGFAILASITGGARRSRLGSVGLPRLFQAAMIGEMIADKTLDLPRRTELIPWVGRIVLGGAAATAASSGTGSRRARAALVGALCAAATAWAATRLRSAAAARGAPDVAPALVEDVMVLALGSAADRLVGGEAAPRPAWRPIEAPPALRTACGSRRRIPSR